MEKPRGMKMSMAVFSLLLFQMFSNTLKVTVVLPRIGKRGKKLPIAAKKVNDKYYP